MDGERRILAGYIEQIHRHTLQNSYREVAPRADRLFQACPSVPAASLSLSLSPFLFFSFLSVSITVMTIPEWEAWCVSRGRRRIFRDKGEKERKKMKKEKEERIENRKFLLRFTFSKKKSNYNESAKLKEKEKGENLNFWYVSTTRTIIITAKLYP